MTSTEWKKLVQTMRMMSTQAIMLHQAIADSLSLNLTDYKCLDLIARFGPLTAGKLAEYSGLTTGAITGVIDRLETAGYAKRTDNPIDRRSVIVKLTWDEKRKKDYEETFHPLEKKMEGLVSRYTHKEVLLFTEFIQKTTDFLHEETSRLSAASQAQTIEH
jgi:DNA-binding MarR family transcriptional regulator